VTIAPRQPRTPLIVPVLDVRGGHAVHALAGRRAEYLPIRSRLYPGSDPAGIARVLIETLGLPSLYLADLDAIEGARPAFALIETLAGLGARLWVDAGLRGPRQVDALLAAGAATLVAGSETLDGPERLRAVVARAGAAATVFSLDLLDGRPRLAPGADWGTAAPRAIAARALDCGVRRVLLLDLARVGTGRGVGTLELTRELAAGGAAAVAVGGGIATAADIEAAGRAGATAVLVGTALHTGAITVERA
jgi:phosphoribosylformimino-5-aminoimidazole carboxamide ribotide isomerase